jgi:single-stranded DNA-binding protein
MLDALISGKLVRDTELKTSAGGTAYTQFMLSVSYGEPQAMVITGVGFGEVAERIAKLSKGDSLAVIGSLKPSEWQDKTTGETKHGMNITASSMLSVYDFQKKRKDDEQG